MTALINILLYFPLFLKLRGNLLVRTDGWFKWKWRWGRRDGDDAWLSTVTVGGSIVSEDTRMRDSTTVAKQMLWSVILFPPSRPLLMSDEGTQSRTHSLSSQSP
jgi:hypothetical protein